MHVQGRDWATCSLLIAVLAVQAAGSAAATGSMLQPQDALYLKGYLTWNGGPNGGIAWDWFAQTQDKTNFPLPASVTDYYANQEKWTQKVEGKSNDVPSPFVFVSDPVPMDVHINQSRPIPVNMSFAPAAGAYLLEIWIQNGPLVAGTTNFVAPNPKCGNGLSLPFLRSEVSEIPKGARIELRLWETDFCGGQVFTKAQYGRSSINLPHLSDDDALLRVPGFNPTNAPTQNLVGTWSTGLGGAVVLGLMPLGRRRGLVVLAAALMATGGLAGCFGHGGRVQADVHPTAGSVEAHSIDAVNGGGASIYGDVRDLVGRPIARAHVTIIGTDNTTLTDNRGQFHLDGVPLGNHRIRFDKLGYRSIENSTVINPDRVNIFHVKMAPSNYIGPDSIPHGHDRWPAQEATVAVFAGDVPSVNGRPMTDGSHCLGPNNVRCESSAAFTLPDEFQGNDPNVILPGTIDLEYVISWTGGSVDRAGLEVQSPVDGSGAYCPAPWASAAGCPTYYSLQPRKNGEVGHLAVGVEMMDNGHARFTMWSFKLYVPTITFDSDQLLPAGFHVAMKIHKGVVPLEPAHRDFWGKREAIALIDYVPGASPVHWAPGGLVPPETKWIDVVLEQSQRTNVQYAISRTTAQHNGKDLTLEPPFKRSELRVEYRRALCDDQPDAFYQTTTRWVFTLQSIQQGVDYDVANEEDQVLRQAGTSDSGVGQGALVFALTVTAHRGDPPSDGQVQPPVGCS